MQQFVGGLYADRFDLLPQNRSATRHILQITEFTKPYKQKHDVNKKNDAQRSNAVWVLMFTSLVQTNRSHFCR